MFKVARSVCGNSAVQIELSISLLMRKQLLSQLSYAGINPEALGQYVLSSRGFFQGSCRAIKSYAFTLESASKGSITFLLFRTLYCRIYSLLIHWLESLRCLREK